MSFGRQFGAWQLQRQDERKALREINNYLRTRVQVHRGVVEESDQEGIGANYLCSKFVAACIRRQDKFRQEKRRAREVENEKRREIEKAVFRADQEVRVTSNTVKKRSYKKYLEKCLAKKKLKEEARVAREMEEEMRREAEEKKLKADNEKKRRLRIIELSSAQVRY